MTARVRLRDIKPDGRLEVGAAQGADLRTDPASVGAAIWTSRSSRSTSPSQVDPNDNASGHSQSSYIENSRNEPGLFRAADGTDTVAVRLEIFFVAYLPVYYPACGGPIVIRRHVCGYRFNRWRWCHDFAHRLGAGTFCFGEAAGSGQPGSRLCFVMVGMAAGAVRNLTSAMAASVSFVPL